MSQLAKALTLTDTGKRVFSPMFNQVFTKKEEWQRIDPYSKIYLLRAIIGTEVAVVEHHGSIDYLELAIDQARRYIIEAIFGEFRQDFYLINHALYNQDFLEASKRLKDFEVKMFTDE